MLLPIGIIFMMVILGISLGFTLSTQYDYHYLKSGWDASYQGQSVRECELEEVTKRLQVTNNEKGTLTTSLVMKEEILEGKDMPAHPTILLDVYYLGVEVFLDGVPLKTVNMERLESGRFLDSRYQFVSLPDDFPGKTLTIVYHYDGSKAQTMVAAPAFGDFENLYYSFILHNLFPFLAGAFLLLFGIYFLVVSVSVSAIIPEIMGQMVSAILSLVFGIWIIGTFRISFLFMRSEHITAVTNIAFLQFVPLLFLLLWQVHPIRYKKLFFLLFIMTGIVSELTILLHITGFMHITRLRIVYYVMSVLFMGYLLYTDYEDIKEGNTDVINMLQLSGFTLSVIFAFSSMVYYVLTGLPKGNPPSTTVYTIYGIGCVLLVLTRYLIFLILLSRAEGQRVEFESLSRIANTDVLTGLYNRIFCEERFSWLDATEQKQYCIVSLDINHLKYVNDTFGHAKGDTLLIGFADALKSAFPEDAFCCRVGGDEFVVILDERYDVLQLERFLSKLKVLMEGLNETEPMIPHSAAAGYAFKRDLPDKTAHEILLVADHRMYEQKREQKRKDGIRPGIKTDDRTDIPISITPSDENTMTGEEHVDIDSRRKLDSMFSTLEVLVEDAILLVIDLQYRYSRWSKNAVEFFGLPGEYMMNADKIWGGHIHPEDRTYFQQNVNSLMSNSTDHFDVEYRALTGDGRYVICTNHGSLLKGEGGKPEYFIGTIRNHDLKEYTDPITGLRNQYGYTNDVADSIKVHTAMNILLIDIARFGQINDLYGYAYGSQMLTEIGKTIQRETENIGELYRMDGARFAIISHKASEKDMQDFYDMLQSWFKTKFTLAGKRQSVALNGGFIAVNQFNIDATTVASCLTYAVRESAIRHNGNLVVFQNELTDANRRTLERLHSIRDCITDNYHGFYLRYQYLVDAKREEIYGAEALLRWTDEDGKDIPPSEFVPVLEQDPLFPNLGAWILRQALADAKRFLQRYPNFVINVNLSYTQLERSDFVAMTNAIIRESGYPPNQICLELTESCRVLEPEVLKNIIASLKTLGVQFALDDFGTGYSSLNMIRTIPFNVVKIDKLFIDGIENDRKQAETVRIICRLAELYKCRICVEGVETEDARDALLSQNIDIIQGYFYATPERIEDLL